MILVYLLHLTFGFEANRERGPNVRCATLASAALSPMIGVRKEADLQPPLGIPPGLFLNASMASSTLAKGRRLVLVAACALVDPDGRVLLAKRPQGRPLEGLWEFPGGKVEVGETPERALIRELKEELSIDVSEACLAPYTFASHAYDGFHLLMPLYVCRRWKGEVIAREGQELAWVRPVRMGDYAMPPADEPLRAMLRDLLE